jgi:hypothetical protein
MALFQLKWKDKWAMLINLTAMTTGLRIGEILALHLEDIGDEYLTIQWSYSLVDGLKSIKTDEPRTVPVIPEIRDALIRLGRRNPHENGFVFSEKSQISPEITMARCGVCKRCLFNYGPEKLPIKKFWRSFSGPFAGTIWHHRLGGLFLPTGLKKLRYKRGFWLIYSTNTVFCFSI